MTKSNVITEQKPFSFKNHILYPACTMFAVIIMSAFTVMHLLGLNVTEARDKYISKYDGQTDDYVTEWLVGDAYSLSPQMLFGILLFCFAVFALSYLRYMEFSKLTTRLLHFSGTLLSLFLFVLTFSGYISDSTSTFGSIMLALMLVGILYFICLGIKLLLKRPITFLNKKTGAFIRRFIAPAIAIFVLFVMVASLLSMFLNVNVIINRSEEFDPNADRSLYTTYETVITPLAPTIQNYLRYLGTAAVIIASIAVLLTKLPKVAKAALNFIICSCGFVVLWFIQLDFFHELDNMRLYSVIAFLAAYLIIFITCAVIAFAKKRKREKTEKYDEQFSVKRN